MEEATILQLNELDKSSNDKLIKKRELATNTKCYY